MLEFDELVPWEGLLDTKSKVVLFFGFDFIKEYEKKVSAWKEKVKDAKTPSEFAQLLLTFVQYIDLKALKCSIKEERFQKWKQEVKDANSLPKIALLLSMFHRSLKIPDLTVCTYLDSLIFNRNAKFVIVKITKRN